MGRPLPLLVGGGGGGGVKEGDLLVRGLPRPLLGGGDGDIEGDLRVLRVVLLGAGGS